MSNLIKKIFDMIFSLLGIIILSPIFLVTSLLIKLGSSGPVLYKGTRVGKNKKLFKMYKFRTMVINADKIGGPSTSKNDSRLTKIGKIIRKYKIDEIPQLINVLKGEMSFVGPRPEVLEEVKTYTKEEKQILKIKPGITDWASIVFRNEGEILKGSENPHKTYIEKIRPEKHRLEIKYVKNHNIFIDLKILFKTILTILKG